MSPPLPTPLRGRWAPSPTGLLHVGSARTALAAWLSIRSRGGAFVWRLEDLDPPRVVPGTAEAAMEDLAWLGLDWDEGPDRGGPHAPYAQSRRGELYAEALRRLEAAGRLFPCRRSRKDLESLASAPHGPAGHRPYPASLRPRRLAPGWLEAVLAGDDTGAAVRFRVDPEPVTFDDAVYGTVTERVDATVGDFVLRRRDGLWAYQLAVVVDDAAMGITEVVRGRDLLGSTARQIQLQAALGAPPVRWVHLPLVVDAAGEKLSKRHRGLTLRSLRRSGTRAEDLTGTLAWSLGLLERPEPCRPEELLPRMAWEQVRREDWRLPPGDGLAG